MQESDFEMPTEMSRDDLTRQIAEALSHGDHQTARSLLRNGLECSPDDNRLLRLAAKQRKQEERFVRFYALLRETREAMEDDSFVRAVGALREAANLSRGSADLEEAVFGVAVEEAQRLGDRNWRVARSLLEEASGLHATMIVADRIWDRVRAAEREETIASVLSETALAKPDDLERARQRLTRTLEQYPDDSGLLNRLKSLESTIAEKRQWNERQRRLKQLTELQAALQREENPAEASKYVRLSEALAAPYGAERELSSVIEDIRHQIISCERAEEALKQDRIEDCLEECAWVLSRMRHHQLFLKLKQKAEERELALVDEYSDAVSRIRGFLDAGELAEAEKLCFEARTKLPRFTDFLELSREIEQLKAEQDRKLQETVDSAMRLVERGDRSLRTRQFRAAEESFASALKLLPGDENLAGVVLAILHGYARSVARESAKSAEEALTMAERLLPGSAAPADLVEGLRRKREQEKAEVVRWSALNTLANLDGQIESAKKAEALNALRGQVKDDFAASSHADVREAAGALSNKIDEKLAALDRKRERQPAFLKPILIAAALIAVVGFPYWMSHWVTQREPVAARVKPLLVEKAPGTKPLPAATLDMKLTPKPASVEIRGAAPDTRIKLDGVLQGTAKKNKLWTKQLAAGSHAIELSRNGCLPKTIVRNLAPGELFVLAGSDVRLESSDARGLTSERQDWSKLGSGASLAAIESFVAKHPNGPHAHAARARVETLQWQRVDKGNTDSLRAFMAKYPASPFTDQAKRDLDGLIMAREAKAATAGNALAELEREAHAAEAQSLEEAAWKKVNRQDEGALESYLRDSPAGRHRSEAEAALAALRWSDASKNDTVAVLSVISRFASAWNTKDLDSILAIQKTLNKRAVKAELSRVKELNMRISPASPPQIAGSQAVVLCRRQASRVLSNGTRKQMPETIVSYVLEKHDGNWTIEGTR